MGTATQVRDAGKSVRYVSEEEREAGRRDREVRRARRRAEVLADDAARYAAELALQLSKPVKFAVGDCRSSVVPGRQTVVAGGLTPGHPYGMMREWES